MTLRSAGYVEMPLAMFADVIRARNTFGAGIKSAAPNTAQKR